MSDVRVGCAVHEAGHAIVFMLNDAPIDEAVVKLDGSGYCRSDRIKHLSPAALMTVAFAGQAAEEMLLDDGAAESSDADDEIFAFAARKAVAWGPINRGKQYEQACALMGVHADAVLVIANALLDRGQLLRSDMGALCWAHDELADFRMLYAPPWVKPKAKKPQPAASCGCSTKTSSVCSTNFDMAVACNAAVMRGLNGGTASIPRGWTHAEVAAAVRSAMNMRR
ncbi:MAG: hypothetical protein H0T47_08620 [Planctomycetaceae bacterium]|nr:hypothetical protein [Planctomycetaceae bacterium]